MGSIFRRHKPREEFIGLKVFSTKGHLYSGRCYQEAKKPGFQDHQSVIVIENISLSPFTLIGQCQVMGKLLN